MTTTNAERPEALCPECQQDKHRNCTGEAMLGEVLVACSCAERAHQARTAPLSREERVYSLVDSSGRIGVTIPEVQGSLGLPRPGVPLNNLVLTGRLVKLCEARSGWNVYVTTDDVAGREIETSHAENKTGETDND